MRRFTLVVVLGLAWTVACASTPSGSSAEAAGGARDQAACKKMCEVAGDAEGKPDEVTRCQEACDAP